MTVCIIDDDLVSQFATRYSIEQSNRATLVVSYDSAEDALDSFMGQVRKKEALPDIILLDLVMPGMDGWEFLRQFEELRNQSKSTEVFVLSAFVNAKDRKSAKDHPMIQGYFDKPLSKIDADRIFRSISL